MGVANRRIIDDISDDKLIIGFTATLNTPLRASLATLLPHLIHQLDLKEAIMLGMLSPVIPVAFAAPTSVAQKLVIGTLGEYENKALKN